MRKENTMPQNPTRTTGSRIQVKNKTADKTAGGLTKSNLKKNKAGNIVSKAASEKATRKFPKVSKQFAAWREASREQGYLIKNQAKLLPKKGTLAYQRLRSAYKEKLRK